MKIRVDTIKDSVSVEELIYNSKPRYKENLNALKQLIESAKLDDKRKRDLLEKVGYSIKRINAPLDFDQKLKYLIEPYGIKHSFIEDDNSDVEHFRKFGFIKKEKEYYRYSAIGAALYIVGGIAIGMLLKYLYNN